MTLNLGLNKMTRKIKLQLNDLSRIFTKIQSITNNNKNFGNTKKETLFLSYYDLDMEHIQSIHLLLVNELNGSAFALVRTFYEAFYRALWMNAYATDKEVDEIYNDKFKFNNMGSKILQLDSYYTGSAFFKDMKRGTWSIMSDYTHAGTNTLSRRFTDGKLIPNYRESEVLEVIVHIRETILLFAYTLVKIHEYSDEEAELLELIKSNNDISQEILDDIYE